jgi:hypothetical protein
MRERAVFIEVRSMKDEVRTTEDGRERMEDGRCISILAERQGNGKGEK